MDLRDLLKVLNRLSEADRKAIEAEVTRQTAGMRFTPLPGAQTAGYVSAADILLYGGASGGGKSAMLIGLAAQEHQRSIIFRRESSQTDGLVAYGREVIGDAARFNGTDLEWAWEDGRSLKLAGLREPEDWRKFAGRERDFLGFDEAGEFLESQVTALMAWLRAEPGRRCRVVLASNPPRDSDGAWLVSWFAPWLDRQFPDPAAAGELRWAVMCGGRTVWVDGPGQHEIDGETYIAMSRTFIPARLDDNAYRNTPEYRARLQSLPEPLRSQLLYGDFSAGVEDNPWQAIPTDWVRQAMSRWTSSPPAGTPMCSLGVDVAQAGSDSTVIAKRHDSWFAPLIVVPGNKTPTGTEVAGLVLAHRRDGAAIVIDVGGGWGAEAYGHLRSNGIDNATAYMGVKASLQRSADLQLTFSNVRSEAYWRLREALKPDQAGGSPIALPDDRQLLADLTAPAYEVRSNGVVLEPKEKLVKRLGRSPDRGDAVVMSWWAGARMSTHYGQWNDKHGGFGPRVPQVIMKRQPLTARR